MSEKLLCYLVSGLILCEENMRHSERLRRCYNHRSGVSDRVHSHFAWLMEISCLICINFPLFHYSGRCTHWSAPRNPGLSLADKMWFEEADDWWWDWAQWTGLLANIHPSLAQQAQAWPSDYVVFVVWADNEGGRCWWHSEISSVMSDMSHNVDYTCVILSKSKCKQRVGWG